MYKLPVCLIVPCLFALIQPKIKHFSGFSDSGSFLSIARGAGRGSKNKRVSKETLLLLLLLLDSVLLHICFSTRPNILMRICMLLFDMGYHQATQYMPACYGTATKLKLFVVYYNCFQPMIFFKLMQALYSSSEKILGRGSLLHVFTIDYVGMTLGFLDQLLLLLLLLLFFCEQ